MIREMFEHVARIDQLTGCLRNFRKLAGIIDQNKRSEAATIDVAKAAQQVITAPDMQSSAAMSGFSDEIDDLADAHFDRMMGQAFLAAALGDASGLVGLGPDSAN